MKRDSAVELIKVAYAVALDPRRFDDLIASWDRWSASKLDGDLESARFLIEASELDDHFDSALEVAADPRLDSAQILTGFLDGQSVPTLFLSDDFEIRHLSKTARAAGQSLAALEASLPANRSAVAEVREAIAKTGSHALHLQPDDTDHPVVAIVVEAPTHVRLADTNIGYVIRFSASSWSTEVDEGLKAVMGLSDTEVAIGRMLCSGLSAADSARHRDRSVETVRSQIKTMMFKTGAQRQAGLIQFFTMFQHLMALDPLDQTGANASNPVDLREVVRPGGRVLSYAVYGPSDGHTMLYLTTSSRPEETPEVRAAFIRAGFRVIAPFRPGFGLSARGPKWTDGGPALLSDCRAILEDLGLSRERPLLCVGHREGAVLAARAAAGLAADHAVQGVGLLSCGAPAKSLAAFADAPPNARRSILAGHYLPIALRMGYRTAARLFHSGPEGEDRIVGYFFKDDPEDCALLSNRKFYRITRENIAFSFENSNQIVEDIALWSSDWAPAGPSVPWTFFHGRAHRFMMASAVERYCATRPDAVCDILEGAGQMALYLNPDRAAAALKHMVSSPAEAV
ncbi:MAG: hypothetical protein AAFV09_10560 [Pseudomonadota bacterium]